MRAGGSGRPAASSAPPLPPQPATTKIATATARAATSASTMRLPEPLIARKPTFADTPITVSAPSGRRRRTYTRPVKVGVLTAGGDCPGLNAVIRAVARKMLSGGHEPVGLLRGYQGLAERA